MINELLFYSAILCIVVISKVLFDFGVWLMSPAKPKTELLEKNRED